MSGEKKPEAIEDTDLDTVEGGVDGAMTAVSPRRRTAARDKDSADGYANIEVSYLLQKTKG